MFNLRFSPEYTPPNDQKRSGGIDSSPVREAGSCSRKSVREALTVGQLRVTNLFYERGCQEKTLPHRGGRWLFSDVPPQ